MRKVESRHVAHNSVVLTPLNFLEFVGDFVATLLDADSGTDASFLFFRGSVLSALAWNPRGGVSTNTSPPPVRRPSIAACAVLRFAK